MVIFHSYVSLPEGNGAGFGRTLQDAILKPTEPKPSPQGDCLPCKVNWGIGMIAMPFYLHAAGLEAGLLFFVLSMLLAWDAANVMHHLAQRLQETPERQAGFYGRLGEAPRFASGFCYRSFMFGLKFN